VVRVEGSVALVVDDDPDVALVCALQLQSAGFSVLEAPDGERALALARSEVPSVILLDLMLPDVDGLEVLRRLKADPRTRDIPVVMLTARTGERDRLAAWRAGASDYLTKPFDGDRLVDAVRSAASGDSHGIEPRAGAWSMRDSAWLAGVVRGAHDAIICKTLEGEITHWNRGAERLYGWHASEVVGRHIAMLTSTETAGEVPAILARVSRGETVVLPETVRLHRDGHRFHVSLCVSPILGEDGEVVGASAIARELLDRGEDRPVPPSAGSAAPSSGRGAGRPGAEDLLGSQADELCRAVVEAAPDAMTIVAEDGTILLVNAQMVKLFGYDRDELVGRTVEVLVPSRYRARHATHRRHFQSQATVRPMGAGRELTGLCKDGSEFAIEISLSPLPREAGVDLTCATVRDVTERRMVEAAKALAAEREREATARLREIDRLRNDFLSTVSHELRTPLTAIKGFSQWLTDSWDHADDQRKREMLERIHLAGQRLDLLIQDLLDFTRLERGQLRVDMGPRSLATLVDEAVRLTGGVLHEHVVEVDVGPDLVLADRATLLRVLENLLTNAAKFSDAGTVIEVRSEVSAEHVELSVRDHGMGIPAPEHAKVFDRFYRVPSTAQSTPGTGIGLAIVKQFVEAQGGSVAVRSPRGGGTEFSVRLRRASGQA
jgi:PAS domain S-box-containing protein